MQFYLLAPRMAGGGRDKAQAQARAIATLSVMHGRIAQAWVTEAAGDRAGAQRAIESVAAQYPDSTAPMLALGALQQRAKQWDAALATYQRLLARDPDAREAHYQIGRVASESGRALPAGAAALEKFVATPAAEEDAPLASAWQRLAAIREKEGDPTRARSAYQQALRLDPGLDDAKAGLKRVGR